MNLGAAYNRAIYFGFGLKHGFCTAVANNDAKIKQAQVMNKAIETHYGEFISDPERHQTYKQNTISRQAGEAQGIKVGRFVRDRLRLSS